jgi:hypothetical protein
MTRNEAEMLAIKAVGFEFSEDARRHLVILETLGILKFEEPKTVGKLIVEISKTGNSHRELLEWVGVLNDAGLQIIKKGQ